MLDAALNIIARELNNLLNPKVKIKVSKPFKQDVAVSTKSVLYGATKRQREFNAEVVGNKWYGTPSTIGYAEKMFKHGRVHGAHMDRVAPLLANQAIWEATENPRQSPEDIEFAQLLNTYQKHIFTKFVNLSCDAHRDGFAHLEFIEEVIELDRTKFPNHPTGYAIVFKDIKHKPAWQCKTWVPNPKDESQALGYWQYRGDGDSKDVYIDYEKELISRVRFEQNGDDYAGHAIQRYALNPFKLLTVLETISGVKHEKYGLGVPVSKEPETVNPDDRDNMIAALENYYLNEQAFINMPNGWELEILGSQAAIGTDIDKSAMGAKSDISRAYGNKTGDMGDGKFGSMALATHKGKSEDVIQDVDAGIIAEAFNVGFDKFCPMEHLRLRNYPNARKAMLKGKNFPNSQHLIRMETVANLTTAGVLRASPELEVWALEGLSAPVSAIPWEERAPQNGLNTDDVKPDESSNEDEDGE